MLTTIKKRTVDWLKDQRHDGVLPHVRGELLDIGCGTNELVRRHGRGIGVDVFDWKARNMIVVEDTSRLPFASKNFDTVTLVACLNHIPNREDVLLEARRVLKDEGRMIITMIGPGISRFWHGVIRKEDEDQSRRGIASGEVWGFTPGQIKELLQKTGFKLVGRRRIVFGLNNIYIAEKS